MRLLVCGGRDYADRRHVWASLDRVHAKRGITVLIHGKATGADHLAYEWADRLALEIWGFPAAWAALGRAAGPIRNQAMIDVGKPDGVVAFAGGAGTADMVRRAMSAGLPVWRP